MREWVAVEAPERILPTLFYILTLLAYFTHHARILFVVLVLLSHKIRHRVFV